MTRDSLCRSIGLGGRRAADFLLFGLKAIDLYRLTQIADRLDVSRAILATIPSDHYG